MQNANQKFLAVVIGLVVAIVVVFGLGSVWPTATDQYYAPEQPIPFSHKLHAGKYKMQCIYCHVSAEKSIHATVPSLNICMNCHSVVKGDSPWIQKMRQSFHEGRPIEWVRIHELPDFVRFNHKRHIAKGVACETCHGNIREMDRVYQAQPLTMGWCMECHRGETTPRDVMMRVYPNVPNPQGPVAPTSCDTCHY